jgi:hypothetical protein
MGGLLSGIDQSLISGANLFMPSCKSKSASHEARLLTSKKPSASIPTKSVWSALVFLSVLLVAH